jgi:DNA polymerase
MKAEMAVRYWKSLPEAALISELLHNAPQRVEEMLARSPKSAASLVPQTEDSTIWERALQRCDICSFACESRPVAGRGSFDTPWLLLVPVAVGDRLLSPESETWLQKAFEEFGLPWEKLRITAAVKHAKSSPVKPQDIAACKPWLSSELLSQRPEVILCSGLNAGLALWGRLLRWSEVEGRVFATRAAPRSIVCHDLEKMLRLPPGAERERQEKRWRDDLRSVLNAPP